jgi:hypothetical protein
MLSARQQALADQQALLTSSTPPGPGPGLMSSAEALIREAASRLVTPGAQNAHHAAATGQAPHAGAGLMSFTAPALVPGSGLQSGGRHSMPGDAFAFAALQAFTPAPGTSVPVPMDM